MSSSNLGLLGEAVRLANPTVTHHFVPILEDLLRMAVPGGSALSNLPIPGGYPPAPGVNPGVEVLMNQLTGGYLRKRPSARARARYRKLEAKP